MKVFLSTLVALTSLSAFSGVELYSKFEGRECWISGQQVKVTTSIHKGELSFTQTKDLEVKGLEALAARAASQSSGRSNADFVSTLTLENGQKYSLHYEDSSEAMAIITMMGQVCH